MIEEAYCSFEVAKLLKEKGFDEPCECFYDTENNDVSIVNGWMDISNSELEEREIVCYSAPTHQMAMAWLREKYGIFIAINNDDLDFNWQCYDLINRGSTLDPKILSESYGGFKHYEEAVEAALKYCLENLL